MEKRRKLWIILGTALAAVLALGAIAWWFFSDGVHFLGPFVHIDGEIPVFVWDNASGGGREPGLTGERTTLVISGTGCTWDLPGDNVSGTGTFEGRLHVPGYPDDGYETQMPCQEEDGFLCVRHQVCEAVYGEDGRIIRMEPAETYWFFIDRSDGSFLVLLFGRDGGLPAATFVSSDDPVKAERISYYFVPFFV